jgi:hypothetical protein
MIPGIFSAPRMNSIEKYYCPCCGYDGLSGPAYAQIGPPPWSDFGPPPYSNRLGFPSYEVCACCSYEFGFDDDPGPGAKSSSFEEYRSEWLASGAAWFNSDVKPKKWNLKKQLRAIGLSADD